MSTVVTSGTFLFLIKGVRASSQGSWTCDTANKCFSFLLKYIKPKIRMVILFLTIDLIELIFTPHYLLMFSIWAQMFLHNQGYYGNRTEMLKNASNST